MKQDLGPLGSVNLLTDDELRETMGHHLNAIVRNWYRGIDYVGVAGNGNGTGLITLPTAEQGYTWDIKLVSAQLSAAGALSVYASDNNNTAPVGCGLSVVNGTANEVVLRWSSEQLVLKDGRNITLASAVTIVNYRILAKQVPTEMQGKL